MNPANPQRVIVGLSGGVDSSVAALELMQRGYEVEALFMKNWEEDDAEGYCSAAADLADASAVAERLGIRLHSVNFASEYWDHVFEYFLREYRAGRTPNPDILCNREIKFKAFLDFAQHLGADSIATGHYARRGEHNGEYVLLKGLDANKDQSYFLYTLQQPQLRHSLFPLGELEKTNVRRIARDAGFVNHAKKDSTGICFIGERKFRDFLNRFLPAQPGDIVDDQGRVLGQHSGLMFHTLGQRQGLGIGGTKDSSGAPWFVADKDLPHNRLLVVQGHDHPLMLHRYLRAAELSWVSDAAPALPLRCSAKIRYRQADQPCTLIGVDANGLQVKFDQPQRAIAPGQSVVFYTRDICLGGAIIQSRSNQP